MNCHNCLSFGRYTVLKHQNDNSLSHKAHGNVCYHREHECKIVRTLSKLTSDFFSTVLYLQEIGGPIRAIERVSAADSDSENQDRNVFNVEVCVNPDSSHRTIDSQSMETEQVTDQSETISNNQIVNQLDSEQSVGEILIDQSKVEPTQISQSDVGEEVQEHLITSAIKVTYLNVYMALNTSRRMKAYAVTVTISHRVYTHSYRYHA